ncbi:MAG: shikimate dehydrogenase [Gammaproteobacteria bacterium RBG_16_57_12]|nr:MAG: shikimate dehydrogenase [Gammaproteobacteria bacterium RBG_16_57_12]
MTSADSLFDFERPPDSYAVMGNPIAHSKSPQIHALFARQTRQRMTYTAILVEPGGLAQAVGNFCASGGKGLNITVPFKQDAFRLADERSARAQLAGAVNTLLHREDGTLYGDNTDGAGLVRDICQNHAGMVRDRRILLLGAGGASRGVIGPLLDERPSQLTIANRTADKAEILADEFSALGNIRGRGFPQLGGNTFDFIINATSASLKGETLSLPEGLLAGNGWCYDMMYAREPTPFLRWAALQDAAMMLDGLGMLVEQAAEAFYLWRGVRPDTGPVIAQLRRDL